MGDLHGLKVEKKLTVAVKNERYELLDHNEGFMVEKRVDLRFGEEHFFVRGEEKNVNFLILRSFAEVIMKETDNNFVSGSFRFLIFRSFDIGEIRRLVFFLGKAFFRDVFILLGR